MSEIFLIICEVYLKLCELDSDWCGLDQEVVEVILYLIELAQILIYFALFLCVFVQRCGTFSLFFRMNHDIALVRGVMNMNKKSIMEGFSKRITELRREMRLSRKQMAAFFVVTEVTYRRYEQGVMLPGFLSMYTAGVQLGVSLDWLVYGRSPVYYKEIEEKLKKQDAPHEAIAPEVLNLLEHIKRVPLVRNEMLSYFYKIRIDHEEAIVKEMERTGAVS